MTTHLPAIPQSLPLLTTRSPVHPTRRQFGHALTGLTVALALAACGGGGSESAADAGTGAGTGTGTGTGAGAGTGTGTGTGTVIKGFSVQIIAGAPSWKVFSDYGTADGTGTAARFQNIQGLAQASNGDIWVSDTDNNTLRRITPAGVVTTPYGLAGSALPSSVAGKGSAARFASPYGMAILKTASTETLYVAESGSGDAGTTNIRAIDLLNGGDATILTLPGGSLVLPMTIAAKVLGNNPTLWVGENGGALRKIAAGNVSTLIQPGLANVSLGVAVNAAGNTVYEAVTATMPFDSPDATKLPGMVVKHQNGVHSVLAGDIKQPGKADGGGAAARFDGITGMTIDSKDNLYVVDAAGIRKITPEGIVSTVVGFVDINGLANTNATTQWDDNQGSGRPTVLQMVSDTEMLAGNNTQVLRITLP